ncbi:hypothetical protein [Aerosakkonema funiforme]|uniref:hypothetical protein n=1 Tax=Aerosakkonema funiforme TaxID=1246630 RepID=UPI0035BAB88D
MSHFNFKSFTFYGLAIGFVVLLFKVVTTYGHNLKAPPPIQGRYRIIAQNLPKCLASDELLLNIQQSGIYLNGSLLTADKNVESSNVTSASQTSVQEKPSLFGLWQNQQFTLSGTTNKFISCERKINVTIQAFVKGETLNGKMTLTSAAQPIEFTAQREATERDKEKSSSH